MALVQGAGFLSPVPGSLRATASPFPNPQAFEATEGGPLGKQGVFNFWLTYKGFLAWIGWWKKGRFLEIFPIPGFPVLLILASFRPTLNRDSQPGGFR